MCESAICDCLDFFLLSGGFFTWFFVSVSKRGLRAGGARGSRAVRKPKELREMGKGFDPWPLALGVGGKSWVPWVKLTKVNSDIIAASCPLLLI